MQDRQNNQSNEKVLNLNLNSLSDTLLEQLNEFEEVSFAIPFTLLKLIESSLKPSVANVSIAFNISKEISKKVKERAEKLKLKTTTRTIDYNNASFVFPDFAKVLKGNKTVIIVLDASPELYEMKRIGTLENDHTKINLQSNIFHILENMPENIKRINLTFSLCVKSNRNLCMSLNSFELTKVVTDKPNQDSIENTGHLSTTALLQEKTKQLSEQEERIKLLTVQLQELQDEMVRREDSHKALIEELNKAHVAELQALQKDLLDRRELEEELLSIFHNDNELSFEPMLPQSIPSTNASALQEKVNPQSQNQDDRAAQDLGLLHLHSRKIEKLKRKHKELEVTVQAQAAKIKALENKAERPRKQPKRGSPNLFSHQVAQLSPQQPDTTNYNPNLYKG